MLLAATTSPSGRRAAIATGALLAAFGPAPATAKAAPSSGFCSAPELVRLVPARAGRSVSVSVHLLCLAGGLRFPGAVLAWGDGRTSPALTVTYSSRRTGPDYEDVTVTGRHAYAPTRRARARRCVEQYRVTASLRDWSGALLTASDVLVQVAAPRSNGHRPPCEHVVL